jgi:EAL domain-containing protein (putative c-di-GMP-specific phosphodiesterase class I)
MGRELKLKVIAEGVETQQQLEFLRAHKCDQAQGFLIGRPVPVAEFEKSLTGAHRANAELPGA